MAESGIYEIVNLVNGKRYVGSAVRLALRWRQHRCELGKGRHNPHLQRSWDKHGADAFEFRVLEIVGDKAKLLEREQHYLDTLKPEYNVAKTAGSNLGVKWGEETLARMAKANREIWQRPGHREKMSAAHKGKKLPREQVEKIAAKNRGRKCTPEQRAAIAERNRIRNQSPEHRARMSKFWKGRAKSPEAIAKMAATKRGKPAHNKGIPASAEQKAKQADAMRRKYANDPDFRKKISERTKAAMADPAVREKCRRGNIGRVHTAEEKAKRNASIRETWARKRAANS